jgi:hypothetical protein
MLCLWLSPAFGLAQDEEEQEVPQGYEDAVVADEARPAVEAQIEEDAGSLIDVLVGALAEDDDPNVANLERQFLPQFQPLLKAELAFIRRACRLNKEQHEQITKSANQRLRLAVKEYAIAQNNMRQGGRIRTRSLPDPRKLVQQQLAKLVKQKLGAEQAEGYQQECDKRTAHRKRATVLNLVAKLDEELVLTAEQRDKLVESLSANYQDAWAQWLEMLMHNNQHLPSIPDQHITPVLNETQKTVWRGARKQGHHIHWGMGLAPAMVMIDDAAIAIDVDVMADEVEFVIEEQ